MKRTQAKLPREYLDAQYRVDSAAIRGESEEQLNVLRSERDTIAQRLGVKQ